MSTQIILMIILAGLILLLTTLLIIRVRREQRLSALLDDLNRKEYNDFLNSNIYEGTISIVARLFSDLLIKSFGCRYIIFIRKKKGQLILNYYHGIRAFNRSDFTLNLNKEIIDNLRLSIFPRNIEEIKKAIVTMKNSYDMRVTMGKANRKRVIEHYSWKSVARRYLEIYQTFQYNELKL